MKSVSGGTADSGSDTEEVEDEGGDKELIGVLRAPSLVLPAPPSLTTASASSSASSSGSSSSASTSPLRLPASKSPLLDPARSPAKPPKLQISTPTTTTTTSTTTILQRSGATAGAAAAAAAASTAPPPLAPVTADGPFPAFNTKRLEPSALTYDRLSLDTHSLTRSSNQFLCVCVCVCVCSCCCQWQCVSV